MSNYYWVNAKKNCCYYGPEGNRCHSDLEHFIDDVNDLTGADFNLIDVDVDNCEEEFTEAAIEYLLEIGWIDKHYISIKWLEKKYGKQLFPITDVIIEDWKKENEVD